MDLRRFGVLIVLCLAAAGCRKDPYMDAYFELLNSEKRVLEDRLYELEYNHEKALKELEQYRAGEKKATKAAPRPEPDSGPSEAPVGDEDGDIELEVPDIQLPPGFESGHRQNPKDPVFRTASASRRSGDSAAKRGSRELTDSELAEAIVAALDPEVEYVYIEPRSTGGADFDRQPGDDGLNVVIEPHNQHGHCVSEPAALTIVLLDPALSGQSARVARWEIDETAAQAALRSGDQEQGMALRLPWPGDKPENTRLNLFVRYHKPSGEVLEAEREIRISPNERVAQGWTPRPPRSLEEIQGPEATVAWESVEESSQPTTVQAVAEEEVAPPVGRFWKPQR
jgi:hypothetical protein